MLYKALHNCSFYFTFCLQGKLSGLYRHQMRVTRGRVEWKFNMKGPGEQFATTNGHLKMQQWCASRWGFWKLFIRQGDWITDGHLFFWGGVGLGGGGEQFPDEQISAQQKMEKSINYFYWRMKAQATTVWRREKQKLRITWTIQLYFVSVTLEVCE